MTGAARPPFKFDKKKQAECHKQKQASGELSHCTALALCLI